MARIPGIGRLKRLYSKIRSFSVRKIIHYIFSKIERVYLSVVLSRKFYNPWRVSSHHVKSVRENVDRYGCLMMDSLTIEQYLKSIEAVSKQDSDWRESIAYPIPYIAELRNMAFISRTTCLLAKNGDVLSDDFADGFKAFGVRSKLWDMEIDAAGLVTQMPEMEFSRKIIKSGIYLMAEHDRNYFHWVVEMLPRVYLYEKLMAERELPLLVTDEFHQNLYDILNLVKDEKRPVIKLKPRSLHRIEKLVCPPIVSRIFNVYDRTHGKDTVYVPVGLLQQMVREIKAKVMFEEQVQLKRLYIRRASTYRHLLNQDEIEAVMRAMGFEVIDPGAMAVKEQIKVFAGADIIVGPSGAAMTNMLWCKPGARVIIFYSHVRGKEYPYWDALARVAGVELNYLFGERSYNKTGFFEAHDDYRVEVSELRGVLEEVELEG